MDISNQLMSTLAKTPGVENNKVESDRLYVPPTRSNADKQNVSSSIATMQGMVLTEEDKIFAESMFDDGVELPRPTKKLDRNNIYSIFNNVKNILLRQSSDFLNSLQHKLEVFALSHQAFNKSLGEKLDALTKQLDGVMNEVKVSGDELNTLNSQAEELKETLESLNNEQQKLKDAGVAKNDPRYQAISEQIRNTEDRLINAGSRLETAKANYNILADKANSIQSDINNEMAQALNNTRFSKLLDMDRMQQRGDEQPKASHRLIYLLNESIKYRAEEAIKRAESERERTLINTQLMSEQRTKQAEKAEKEYEKAQEAAKKSDCISKILSFVIAAVSIVLTVVSGGLASPVTAVLLALTVADMAVTAATGQSFMAKALEPLMNNVFMPLFNMICEAMDFLLEHSPLGKLLKAALPEDVFKNVKDVLKIVNSIAAIIVAGYLLKSAGSFIKNSKIGQAIIGATMKQATKMMQMIAKNIPQILKRMSGKAGNVMANVGNKLTLQNHQNVLKAGQLANAGVGVGNVVQTSVSKIQLAEKRVDVATSQSDLAQLWEIREKQNEMTEQLQESLDKLQKFIANLSEMLAKIINDNMLAGKKILQLKSNVIG